MKFLILAVWWKYVMAVGTVGAGEPILDPITAFGTIQLHLPGGSKSHLLYGVPTCTMGPEIEFTLFKNV